MTFYIVYGVFLVIFYGIAICLKLKEHSHAKRLITVAEKLEAKDKELEKSLARLRKLLKNSDDNS